MTKQKEKDKRKKKGMKRIVERGEKRKKKSYFMG